MRRLSLSDASSIAAVLAGLAAVLAGLAAVAITIGGLELSGDHIWSNSWDFITLVLGGIALLIFIIVVIWVLIIRRHGSNSSSQEPGDRSLDAEEERGRRLQLRPRELSSAGRHLHSVGATRATGDLGHRTRMRRDAPLIAERLELALADGGIRSLRKTPGEPPAQVDLAIPAETLLADYRNAIGEAAALTGPPDEATIGRLRNLVLPLQEVLGQAVPEPTRRRVVAEREGNAKFAAIELMLTDGWLERYPWELIADCAILGDCSLPTTVWRRILSPLDPHVRQRWTSNLLLTGSVTAAEELAIIKNAVTGYKQISVFDCLGIPPTFRSLLNEHPPAAFHLVADEPVLTDLTISPESLAKDLRQSGTWVTVVSCRDSATAPAGGSRPPAYEIAERSGAATIGMAGLTQPDMSKLFSTAFYHCLARGLSALQGYHAAVRCVREHNIYATMWSTPVMYAHTPNVIPFPPNDKAQARLSMERVRFHAGVLDRELEDLVGRTGGSAGEWAREASQLIVRTDCISHYLRAATDPDLAGFPDGRREEINDAGDQLQSALSQTAAALYRLSRGEAEARQETLSRLPAYRTRHQWMLRKLDSLIGEVG